MREWIRPIASFFAVVAGAGLVLCGVGQFVTCLGSQRPPDDLLTALACGLTIVSVAALVISRPLTKDFRSEEFWKAALRGCPHWMKFSLYGLIGYGVLSFFLFAANSDPEKRSGLTGRTTGAYSILIVFYAIAFAVLYSARRIAIRDGQRRCVNGHPAGAWTRLCE